MDDYSRKSFVDFSTETNCYDVVRTTQQDVYDLEDCLHVLETIVEELKIPSLQNSDLRSLMSKYVYMEDSIIEGLQKLSVNASGYEMQQKLIEATNKFNILGYGFQEQWTEQFWAVYEKTRTPSIKNELNTPQNVSKKITDLQDLAIGLARMSRGTEKNENLTPFIVIDEEAAKYRQPSVNDDLGKRECYQCNVFS